MTAEHIWEQKRRYHGRVKALPLREKVAMLIRIQAREAQLEPVRTRLGRPRRVWRVWKVVA